MYSLGMYIRMWANRPRQPTTGYTYPMNIWTIYTLYYGIW